MTPACSNQPTTSPNDTVPNAAAIAESNVPPVLAPTAFTNPSILLKANSMGLKSGPYPGNTLLICLCPTLRMTHDHPTLIKEAPSELLEHERRHRHSITGSRIRMLRLLKRGEAKSVREAGELIGYSWRHTRRWLTTY